jgi:hypothetical protein
MTYAFAHNTMVYCPRPRLGLPLTQYLNTPTPMLWITVIHPTTYINKKIRKFLMHYWPWPWKRNRLLPDASAGHWIPNNNEIHLTSNAEKSPAVSVEHLLLFSWWYHQCNSTYGHGLHELPKLNQNHWNHFWANAILFLGSHLKDPYFWD